MHFALLFLEFRCPSLRARLSDDKGKKTQYITMQKFRFLTIGSTTDRESNDVDWPKRAIIKICYYPQSHLAQTLTL